MVINHIRSYFLKPVHLAPLAIFRMAFGFLMLASVLRFIAKGWVYDMYIKPKLFFPYFGFEWVKPFGETGMYVLFIALAVAALFIALGFLYRISTIFFFLAFTYIELIDKTNYLNHYYFVSIISFLIIFLPAQRYFSIDVSLNKKTAATYAPNYFILILKFQVFIVYFFAGLAKLNSDWLFHAQPLKIWLPAHSEMPWIGSLLTKEWVAYVFSWFGCAYDLFIPFLLFIPRFIKPTYFLVIVFHLATSLFFNIGMFPYIMICLTTIFFTESFHIKIIQTIKKIFKRPLNDSQITFSPKPLPIKAFVYLLTLHFLIQLILPFRYLMYPGNLYWTEQGYRFSWRVMLMEKAGTAFFYVHDRTTNGEIEIDNKTYLTYMQEKMMATQPDMMIDYAKFLKAEYIKQGFKDPIIRAQSYVTLNGRGSREFIDPQVDLSIQSNSFFQNKNWVKKY
ncbi:MAG: HTTM domain-containing protein [Bacteroidetes bacterium]|nr:HTTM domain-containing protein [Bacteroidota bacterium]